MSKEKTIINSGVIEACGEALNQRGIEKENVNNFINLIKRLSVSQKAVDIISKKAIGSVISRAQEYRTDFEISKGALELCEKLLKDPTTAEDITSNGGIEMVVNVLKQQQIDQNVLELALKSLQGICVAGEVFRKLCLNQKCEDYLKQLAKTNRSATIQKHVEAALFSLYNEKEVAFDKQKTQQLTKSQTVQPV